MKLRPTFSFVTLFSAATLGLVGCTTNPNAGTVTETETMTVTESPSSSEEPEPSSDETASESSTPSSTTASLEPLDNPGKGVSEVYKVFHTLAPKELFEAFESCEPNGVADSSACSGPEVGQFQFFASETKASNFTQVLTELKSSRVVEDDGDKIVGWSTLGTMAFITVVDNANQVVAQQMITTDNHDPRERIYELGLATPPEGWSASSAPSSSKKATNKPSGTSTEQPFKEVMPEGFWPFNENDSSTAPSTTKRSVSTVTATTENYTR